MSSMDPPSRHFSGDITQFLEDLLQFIAGDGEELEQLANDAAHGKCGYLLQVNDLYYECKNCESHFASLICASCFEGGNHEGHDYAVKLIKEETYTAAIGGFCDCGDIKAWKQAGFCSKHQGRKTAELSPALHDRTHAAFSLLVNRIRSKLAQEEKFEELVGEVNDITQWVTAIFQQFGEGFTHILTNVIITPIAEVNHRPSPSLLGEIYEMSVNLNKYPSQLRNELHDLCYTLKHTDENYQKAFQIEFMTRYGELIRAVGGSREVVEAENSILMLNTQLIGWPLRALTFVQNGGFKIVINEILRTVEDILIPIPQSPKRLVLDSDRARNVLQLSIVFEDLIMQLLYIVVSKWIVYSKEFQDIIKLFGYVQGMGAKTRITGEHVGYEDTTIVDCATLYNVMNITFTDLLVAGFIAGTDRLDAAIAEELTTYIAPPSPSLLIHAKGVIDSVVVHIEHLSQQQDMKFANIDEGYISTVYDVLSQPVSIHYPLNRLLSTLVQKAIATWNYTLYDLLGDRSICDSKAKAENTSTNSSGIFPLILLDTISSVFAFSAHICAAAWVKNGDAIANMAVIYKEDLATFQLCACMLEPDHILYTLLLRYKLTKWWELTESKDDEGAGENQLSPEQRASAATSFVWLLITVARSNWVKLSVEDTAKMSLIHFLAASPRSHSYLESECKPTHLDDQVFDNIVNQVSTHVLPHGNDQGKHHLKPEFWSQWDPYYYYYTNNKAESQDATEKYEEYCKSIGKYRLPFPTLDPPPPPLSNMRNFLQSKIVHKIIFVSLRNFLASSPHIKEHDITTILHLIYQCLVFSTVPATLDDEEEITITDFPFPSSNIYKNSRTIVKHPALQEDTSIISMLLQVPKAHPSYTHIIEQILELYCVDSKIKAVVQPYLAQVAAPKVTMDKDRLKNKRLEIMNQFKAQQNAFLNKVPIDENEDSSIAAVPQPIEHTCVLCKEIGVAHNPLHFMTLVTWTGLLKHNSTRAWESFSLEKDRIAKEKKLEDELKAQNFQLKNRGAANAGSADALAAEHSTNNNNTNKAKQEHTVIEINCNIPAVVNVKSQQVTPVYSWLAIILRGCSHFIDITLGTVARIIFRPWHYFGLISRILFGTRPAIVNTNTNATEDEEAANNLEREQDEADAEGEESEEHGEGEEGEESEEYEEGEGQWDDEQVLKILFHLLLFKDSKAPDISITSCPHLVHSSCFMKYEQSIEAQEREEEEFDNIEQELKEKREFMYCPLCTTVSNTLVPRVQFTAPPSTQPPFAGDPERWLLQPATGLVQEKENLSSIHESAFKFAKQVAQYDDDYYSESWELLLYNMCDKVATNISHLEIAAREDNKFLLDYPTAHQKDFLRNVAANFAITVTLRNMHQISKAIKTIMVRNDNTNLPSPLKIDTFNLYTIYTISRGIVEPFPDTHDFLCLLYYATIMQALYTLTTKKTELEQRGMACNNVFIDVLAELRPEIAFQNVALRFMDGDLNSAEHPLHSYTQEQIPILCLTFVRKVGLYAESCQQHLEANPQRGFTSPVEEFRYWLTYLHLPDIASLTFWPVVKFTIRWWVDYNRCQDVMPLYPAVRHQLINLPRLYSELLIKFVKAKCSKCSSVPDRPGLCLICGKLVCIKGACCSESSGGECSEHASSCGGFLGLFLDLKGQYIIIIKITAYIWGPLYLDQYGEEDINLKRGVPLYLNEERYTQLRRLYVTKGLDNTPFPLMAEFEDIDGL